MHYRIVQVPDDKHIINTLALWSISEWGADFPSDTVDTYKDLYRQSRDSVTGEPRVFVALDEHGQPMATVTYINNDDLPNAIEPGPWLAALFVHPNHRRHGIGATLVDVVVNHARQLRATDLYLYTADKVDWYARLGWRVVREAELAKRPVTVMTRSL
jgi:N-acetylglutamate synthase-like GNAT family acetyltransferase